VKRIAILCPGRGAYTKRTLNSLPEDHPWVVRAEELRAGYGLPPLLELDRAERYLRKVHLRPDNVSPLIYVISMLDAARAMEQHEAVCAAGNSLGWYTALAVAGALSFEDGFRLVQEMSLLQMEVDAGGQILYPLIDDQWRIEPRQRERVEQALASSGGEAFFSIDLCGYVVLAASEAGIEHLLKALPPVEMGPSIYPKRLAQHGPYHTRLIRPVAERAGRQLRRLDFRSPRFALVNGRGEAFHPESTTPEEIADYTLGPQLTTPFRFADSVRTALNEFRPDLLALPGPGNTLGSICGQVLVAEEWRGLIRNRADFERLQESEDALVWSMRR
jgi:malonyl CoA-acyl carrier protein transacylase